MNNFFIGHVLVASGLVLYLIFRTVSYYKKRSYAISSVYLYAAVTALTTNYLLTLFYAKGWEGIRPFIRLGAEPDDGGR
jgi:hypothetical protein